MRKSTKIVFIFVFLLILLDQTTKFLIYEYFKVKHIGNEYYTVSPDRNEISILGEIVKFVYVENAGMAFGIQFGELKIFLSLFSLFASIVLAYVILKIPDYPFAVQFAFGLILAGAIGNLIDRVFYGLIFGYAPIFYGRVIDFIQVDIPDIRIGNTINYTHWPVFNVADSCVSIGVVLLIIFNKHIPNLNVIFKKKNQSQSADGTN